MATSGATSGLATAGEIIKLALELLGVVEGPENVEGPNMEMGIRHLNWMLKSWQADGCNLYREFEDTAIITAADPDVALDPRVIEVFEARRVEGSQHIPLVQYSRDEYVLIPNKTQSGTPVAFWIDKGLSTVTLTVWPVPSSNTSVKYTAARVIEDVTAHTQNVDVPQEWTEAIAYGLAARLAHMFGVTEKIPALAQSVTARAEDLYRRLKSADRAGSVFLQPY